jgi:hypothetical protein
MLFVEIPDVIDMGEFGADPAEIVPDAGKDGLDLLGRLFRECGGQISAADPLFAEFGPNQPGDPGERLRGLVRIEVAGGPQQANGQRADGGLAERLGRVPKPRLGTSQQRMHVGRLQADHIGSRVRISEAFWPPKPNEFDITAVTRASRALLPTTSNWIAGSGMS